MSMYKLMVKYGNEAICYSTSDYCYVNNLNYDNANVEISENGNVINKGLLYYRNINNTIELYRPTYDLTQEGILKKEGKIIGYKILTDFSSYFKPISDDIELVQFPNIEINEYDVNNNPFQRINLIVISEGGNCEIKVGDFVQYDIYDNGEHYEVEYNNGIYVDFIRKIGNGLYILSIINYGMINMDNDNYYILPIYHGSDNSVICSLKFVYKMAERNMKIMYMSRSIPKNESIDIKFESCGGTEIIPIESNTRDIKIYNDNEWLKADYNSGNLRIICNENKKDIRKTNFTFGIENTLYKVNITQFNFDKYNVIVNKDEIKVNGKENNISLKVNSVYGKHDIIIETTYDWIKFEKRLINEGENISLYELKLLIEKNMDYQYRVGYVKIRHSDNTDIVKTVKVCQNINIDDDDVFIEIKDDLIFDSNGTEREIPVTLFPFSDCTFTIKSKPIWMKYKIEGNILKIKCDKNLFSERKYNIVICNNDFPLIPLIKTITQKGK